MPFHILTKFELQILKGGRHLQKMQKGEDEIFSINREIGDNRGVGVEGGGECLNGWQNLFSNAMLQQGNVI